MIINSISLKNFRNHSEYNRTFSKDTTLILGANGCGKTSILEAIYILTRGKSFRATDVDIIKRGTEFYRAALEYDNGEQVIVVCSGDKKTFSIAAKKTSRLPKSHKYPVVLFLPSDLNLIAGSPTHHREYFDQMFSQLNEEYSRNLSRYQKALRQRNEVLKKEHVSKEAIFSWNLMLAKYAPRIIKTRSQFASEINQQLGGLYRSIAENDDQITILYVTDGLELSEEQYLRKLEWSLQKDSLLGHTTFGPHRDDFRFVFNKQPASTSASRGETRSIILALKFLEADLLFKKTGKKPIILLDDVFSELDETRRRCLVSNFKNHQVVITSVNDIISAHDKS